MQKNEVEEVLLMVNLNGQSAIKMKIYKDSTICRNGTGGLPPVSVMGMSFTGSPAIFNKLMEHIPDEFVSQPVFHQDEATPNGLLEYAIGFYGASTNGEHGEHAKWSKSTGTRLGLDLNTTFNHPILAAADHIIMEAAELTNEWYFDVMMNAIYNVKSETLPPQTIITIPKTEEQKNTDIGNYVNQMIHSSRRWSIEKLAGNKTYYSPDNDPLKPLVMINSSQASIRFIPDGSKTSKNDEQGKNKKWWKLW